MGSMFNLLIQNMSHSYQHWRIKLLELPISLVPLRRKFGQLYNPQVAMPIQNKGITLKENTVNSRKQYVPRVVKQERPRKVNRRPILVVNQNQDVDQVVQGVRQENMLGENNLAAMVERIMAQNGMNL